MFNNGLKSGLTFLVFLLIVTVISYGNPPSMDRAALSGSGKVDSTLKYPEYEQALRTLAKEASKKGFNLEQLISDERFTIYGKIDNRFKGSAERKTPTLAQYKKILGFEHKKERGITFVRKYTKPLTEAEKEYGVSKYVIAAIIGIESDYGQNTGSYNPFNVYVSMYAVDYRADFAKAQLMELLAFTERKGIDVFALKSSYAGAMSYAQFIPYSVNKWWVGDELFNMPNNIMSVGNYLAYFLKRTDGLRTSVLRYNPSGLYADAVLDLADAIQKAENRLAAQ